jgi:hypothetical protein
MLRRLVLNATVCPDATRRTSASPADVMDVWTHEQVGGTVQDVGECSSASEGTPVVVCTSAAPVGTGGYVGAGSARVWFGTEAAITHVRSSCG